MCIALQPLWALTQQRLWTWSSLEGAMLRPLQLCSLRASSLPLAGEWTMILYSESFLKEGLRASHPNPMVRPLSYSPAGTLVLLHSEVTLGGGMAGSHHNVGGSKYPPEESPFVELDMLRASSEDTGLRTRDSLTVTNQGSPGKQYKLDTQTHSGDFL